MVFVVIQAYSTLDYIHDDWNHSLNMACIAL